MTDLTPNHPAVEAAARAMHAAYERRAERWEAFYTRTPWEAIGEDSQAEFIGYVHQPLNAALPHLTADDLRATPAGQALMAEAWSKFQEHYATEWEEAYPEDVFPSPAPAPAVVSRESVAASMMRQWAKNLRSDRNPFEEDDA